MLEEDYCSFEVSKLLKEKGFDAESPAMLYKKHDNADGTSEIWTACTLQIVMKWLREVHGLSVETFSIKGTSNICPVFWKGNVVKLLTQDRVFSGELVGSYEEAVEAALKYSLENLI